MMAGKEIIPREVIETFEDFPAEEKKHHEDTWKREQPGISSAPEKPYFRGWLEGKPNPVLAEDPALFPKLAVPSDSGTQLVDIYPGAPIGTKYPTPDPALILPPRKPSFIDRAAEYAEEDTGITVDIELDVGSVFWQRLFGRNLLMMANLYCVLATRVTYNVIKVVIMFHFVSSCNNKICWKWKLQSGIDDCIGVDICATHGILQKSKTGTSLAF